MFFKKRNKSQHGVLHISLNRLAAEDWLQNRGNIGVAHNWAKDLLEITISIDFLVREGLFFHRDANQFSKNVIGSQRIGGNLFEWKDMHSNFVFYFNHELIGTFPHESILDLIRTGTNNKSSSLRHPEEIIIDPDPPIEHCSQMKRQFWSSYGVSYWNDLVKIDFSVDAPVEDVKYPAVS